MSNDLLKQALDALKFYAEPEVYRPDGIGRTSDIRFVAQNAIAALEAAKAQPKSFADLYEKNEQGIEIERLKMRIEELEARPVGVPAGWKPVPIALLRRVEESLGLFVSDHGWAQADMDVMDSVSALLAAPSLPVDEKP